MVIMKTSNDLLNFPLTVMQESIEGALTPLLKTLLEAPYPFCLYHALKNRRGNFYLVHRMI